MQLLLFVILLLGLIFFHELGHIISAKLLGLPISKIGFQWKPYPHFYVAVKRPKNNLQKFIYLFSGSFLTLVLFVISIYNHFFGYAILYWVFVVQFVIELNPSYSDFSIALLYSKKTKSYNENYNALFQKHQFTTSWYVHFFVWVAIVISLIKLKNKLLFL